MACGGRRGSGSSAGALAPASIQRPQRRDLLGRERLAFALRAASASRSRPRDALDQQALVRFARHDRRPAVAPLAEHVAAVSSRSPAFCFRAPWHA